MVLLPEKANILNTVAVCDSEPIAIEGLRSLLESAESLRVVAAESTLMDGMDAVNELRPSILVVDKTFGYQALADCLAALRSSRMAVATIVWGSTFSEAGSSALHSGWRCRRAP